MSFSKIVMAMLVWLLVLQASGLLPAGARADEAPLGMLGSVDFPTSGSEHAQRHFLRGVAALHSFWYEEALEAFRAATATQPDFMMGYWGEAMAHNHPLWREQDTEAARAVLAKISDSPSLTPRERAYLQALKVLYGAGDKPARDRRYALAMERVSREYPEDVEAACFYALALLGTVPHLDYGHRRRIEAGAITLEIFHKNPNHPCAAHYTIHAFDDPDLAILGLPAARRYAEIAPDSHHAQHMPAHIFLQLGMWPEAAARNEAGWAGSVEWVRRKNLSMALRDYHSLHWLLYVYLQQGRYRKAAELLALKQADMRVAGTSKPAKPNDHEWEVGRSYQDMAGAWVVETERWDSAATLWDVPGAPTENVAQALSLFVRGLAAAMLGLPEAETSLAELQAYKPTGDPKSKRGPKTVEIWGLELRAAIQASKQEYKQAIESVKQAVALEEALPPPSGPPLVIKPSHELFGEILLRARRPTEAAQQFATSLQRHPKRARSLLGAARAAVQSGDKQAAATHYATLQTVWAQADEDLPELREVREYR
jgi:tetratricopeptide (TPR) repeat protein